MSITAAMMTTNSLFLRIITKLAINGAAPLTKGFTTEVCQLNAKHPFQLDLLIMNVSWFRFQRLDIASPLCRPFKGVNEAPDSYSSCNSRNTCRWFASRWHEMELALIFLRFTSLFRASLGDKCCEIWEHGRAT